MVVRILGREYGKDFNLSDVRQVRQGRGNKLQLIIMIKMSCCTISGSRSYVIRLLDIENDKDYLLHDIRQQVVSP